MVQQMQLGMAVIFILKTHLFAVDLMTRISKQMKCAVHVKDKDTLLFESEVHRQINLMSHLVLLCVHTYQHPTYQWRMFSLTMLPVLGK